ncbi:MAG: BamA/TamA family outer membrane protein [Rhodothermales bacterium]|nr:BamA/TamA family outer membrane protein [Rhodothermales bacterium]
MHTLDLKFHTRLLICFGMLLTFAVTGPWVLPVHGQEDLFLVDDDTQISRISFEFASTKSFNDETLLRQISLSEPGFRDKYFFWRNEIYPFDPVALQKDVVRLRRFYNRNGFLRPEISYEASTLDVDKNRIHVRIKIEEGTPVIIQDFGFYSDSGDYAIFLFEGELRERWSTFESDISLELGRRYTQLAEADIKSQVGSWLKNRGYAFSSIGLATEIDSTYNTADVRFVLDPGPLAIVDSILVEDNVAVKDRIVQREVPFKVGDRYSGSRVSRGQQALQSMNLFRVVLSDLPEQPVDSTVTVRYRVREVELRRIGIQTGYSRATGPSVEGNWQHRNFFGGARNFNVGFTAITGFKAAQSGNNIPPQVYGASVTLRQPYLFDPDLSVTVSPFIKYEKDSRVLQTDEFNRRYGLTTNLIYEFHQYRSTSLSYTFSRNRLSGGEALGTDDDFFRKSILAVNSTIGKTNNFLNPRRGWILRPSLETAGAVLGSDVEYVKGSAQLIGYIPTTRTSEIIGRLSIGRVIPFGLSADGLDGSLGSADSSRYENRFDDVVFYSGGSTDVRGWPDQLLGTKIAREIFDKDGNSLSPQRFAFEPVGGKSKLEVSISYRFPFPGLGSKWKLATFIDAGQVSSRRVEDGSAVTDDGTLALDNFKFGAGSGIRYETLFGFVRLDLAMKLNPDDSDLISAQNIFNGVDEKSQLRRFRLHLSIGQTF